MIRANILPRNEVAKYIFATFASKRIHSVKTNFDTQFSL